MLEDVSLVPYDTGHSPDQHTDRLVSGVFCEILDKVLVNLRLISNLEEGDKLEKTKTGYMIIAKPGYTTAAWRFLGRFDRWSTLADIERLLRNAKSLVDLNEPGTFQSLRDGFRLATKGLKNLKLTYVNDTLFCSRVDVMLDRLSRRYGI
jgi:hypothetical protein